MVIITSLNYSGSATHFPSDVSWLGHFWDVKGWPSIFSVSSYDAVPISRPRSSSVSTNDWSQTSGPFFVFDRSIIFFTICCLWLWACWVWLFPQSISISLTASVLFNFLYIIVFQLLFCRYNVESRGKGGGKRSMGVLWCILVYRPFRGRNLPWIESQAQKWWQLCNN